MNVVADLAIKLAWGMVGKFMTEKFLYKFFVHGAEAVARKTTNTLDDKWVSDAAEALGVEK